MRTWILALSLLTPTLAFAAAPRICVRQASAMGLSAKLASSVRAAIGDTLSTGDVEVGCRNAHGNLEVSMLRVGSSLRLSFRLLRKKKELAVGDAMTDVKELTITLPDELWTAIESLRPQPRAPAIDETVIATPAPAVTEPTLAADEPAAITPTDDRELEWTRRDWGWTAIGAGGVLLVAAGVTGGLALAKNSELSDLCPNHQCDPYDPRIATRDIEAENRQLNNLALAFDVLLPVGLVAAAGGVLLLTVFDEGPTTALSPWAEPNGGGVMVRGQF